MNWLLVIGAAMLGGYLFAERSSSLREPLTTQFHSWLYGFLTFALIAAWIAWTVNP